MYLIIYYVNTTLNIQFSEHQYCMYAYKVNFKTKAKWLKTKNLSNLDMILQLMSYTLHRLYKLHLAYYNLLTTNIFDIWQQHLRLGSSYIDMLKIWIW